MRMESTRLRQIVQQYKADPESVYNTWFINSEERLKAFRAIRRGVEQVVTDIKAGSFGNDFRGSSLELVLNSITEQKQVFEGAAHPFYWKPKLRIPDIYESEPNKMAFGQFLESCEVDPVVWTKFCRFLDGAAGCPGGGPKAAIHSGLDSALGSHPCVALSSYQAPPLYGCC